VGSTAHAQLFLDNETQMLPDGGDPASNF